MLKNRGIRYLLTVLVVLLLSSGFLGCGGSSGSSSSSAGANTDPEEETGYNPCAIVFTSPVNGTVLAEGTTRVTIKGRINSGDYAAQSLTVDGVEIPFDAATGAFSYSYSIASGAIYSTATFAVTDENGITNKNRISFAVGQSLEAGGTDVVANAARMVVTEGYLDELEQIIAAYVNTWKNDMIYGYTHATYGSHDAKSPYAGATALLPMSLPVSYEGLNLGSLVIDNTQGNKSQGFLNLGPIVMSFDIQSDNTILTDITIASASGVNPRDGAADAGVFIQGYHQYTLLGNPSFAFYASSVTITGATLSLRLDASNQIVATLDTSAADFVFTGATYEYGLTSIPAWLNAAITQVVESALKSAIDIPIIDANSISISASGITTGAWPMNAESLFTSTDTSLAMDLGMYAELTDPTSALVSGLTTFYATPDDALPSMAITGSENIDLALSDDILNNYAFIAMQYGQIHDTDITTEFKEELIDDLGATIAGELTPSNLAVTATLETPPIFDLSTEVAGSTSTAFPAGRIIIRNLLMDIAFDTLDGSSHAMKLSADVDGQLTLTLDADGCLVGGVDIAQSTSTIMTLYSSDVSADLVPAMQGVLANVAINRVLQRMIKFQPPAALDLYGVAIGYDVIGTAVKDNCLIIKGVMSY